MDFLLGVLTTQAIRHGQQRRAQLAVKNREVHRGEEQRSHSFRTGPGDCSCATSVSPTLEPGLGHLKKQGEGLSSKDSYCFCFLVLD